MIKSEDILLFPETISIYKIENFKETLFKKYLKKTKFILNEGTESHRSEEQKIATLDNFVELKKQIILCCKDYVNNKFKLNYNLKITDSWATMTKKGGFSHKHPHLHSFISGVFYPLLKQKAEIKFYRKYTSDFWASTPKEYNLYNSDSWIVPVEKNNLILFKSYLDHEIVKYQGEENRYSIAFNIIPKGNIGLSTFKISLK